MLDNIKVSEITLFYQVCVRVRPLTQQELDISDMECLRVVDQESLVVTDQQKKKRNLKYNWVFDKMCTQKEIFDTCLEYQCLCVLDGYNYTIFSYGSKGTGKSHTLMKLHDDYGMIIRTFNKIFSQISAKKRNIQVKFSYIEIFQENVADLLNNEVLTLEIREDPIMGVLISGAKEIEVNSTQEILNLVNYGKKLKHKMAHEVLILSFAIFDSPGITKDITYSKLIIADLGSLERGGKKNQNISLINLKSCIQSLNEAQAKHLQPYIPYRNSKLTRILKESLGGNSKTLMICCVSPSVVVLNETLNSLETANSAMGIAGNLVVKKVEQNNDNYADIIEQLKKENLELRSILTNKSSIVITNEDEYIKQMQERIINHYNNEQDIMNSIFQYNWELELLKYRIEENQRNLEAIDGIDKKQAENYRQQLSMDRQQSQSYESHLDQLQKLRNEENQKREGIQEQIDNCDLQQTSKMYLSSLKKQHQLKIDNLEIKQKEDFNILQKQQQERELALLRSQIQLRDKIIVDQKQHIHRHLKNNSAQHYSQVDTTTEVIENNQAKLKMYPLPKVKDHYFNREAYLSYKNRNLSPLIKASLETKQKSPYIPPIPNVRIINSLSTPILYKKKPVPLEIQKPIDSASMVSLPKISPSRSVAKFIYDWKQGGYKFINENSQNPPQQQQQNIFKTSPREVEVQHSVNSQRVEQTFYSTHSSRMQRLSPSRYIKQPKRDVHESPYVKGFINSEIQRKYKLFQLNQKMKRVKKQLKQ